MRAFTAFEIPDELKSKLSKIIGQKESQLTGVKWVEKENLHITCKFLGEVSESQLKELISELEKNLRKGISIRVKITGFGAFPDFRRPRVLWLGVEGEKEKLVKVWEEVEKATSKLKIGERERNYIPHLTIGRVKIPLSVEKNFIDFSSEEIHISNLTLFQSTLTPSGPIYRKIKEIPL